ncbi:class I SAM-dependent methyltransferase [Alishewanella sp. HL-SH05]|uniref:class I SAM-dependent methyltransferase n=1 Tax=Alishewanella sp. HL-SH05 TaxID=3461145 RepID=UPI004041B6CA
MSLELITSCNFEKSASIIDVGGGASGLVDHLLQRGYSQVTVLDISAAALAVSQQRLGSNSAAVKWIESDVTAYRPQRQVELWHDRAVFHFLTEIEDRQNYIRALKHALAINGHLIIASFAIGGPEQCSGLPIVQYDASILSAQLGQGFTLVEERTEKHLTPAGREQAFAYFHFVRSASST